MDLDEFAKSYADAWCSQDPESVASFFAEDGSLQVNENPPAVGRDAIGAVAQGFMTALPDMIVTMTKLVLKPKGADFHWRLDGTNTGQGGTGRRVRISGFEEWRMDDDGLIARSRGHFDSDDYERQLQPGADR